MLTVTFGTIYLPYFMSLLQTMVLQVTPDYGLTRTDEE